MKYILNSAVITAPGEYSYRLITPEQAREWAREAFTSTVGYEETAAALSVLLGCDVAVNRVMIQMQPGDEALVFRLALPPGTPRINPQDKGRILQALESQHFEIGLLRRIS